MVVEARDDNQSSDAGQVLVRDVLDRAGLFDTLDERIPDPRDPERTIHSLSDHLRTVIGLLAQSWGDLPDVEGQTEDAVLRVATRRQRGRVGTLPVATNGRWHKIEIPFQSDFLSQKATPGVGFPGLMSGPAEPRRQG